MKTPYTLVVALCPNDGAQGNLFIDDGIQNDLKKYVEVDYQANSGKLTATVKTNTYQPAASLPVEAIKIVGKGMPMPSKVTLNGKKLDASMWSMDTSSSVLTVSPSIMVTEDFELTWE